MLPCSEGSAARVDAMFPLPRAPATSSCVCTYLSPKPSIKTEKLMKQLSQARPSSPEILDASAIRPVGNCQGKRRKLTAALEQEAAARASATSWTCGRQLSHIQQLKPNLTSSERSPPKARLVSMCCPGTVHYKSFLRFIEEYRPELDQHEQQKHVYIKLLSFFFFVKVNKH